MTAAQVDFMERCARIEGAALGDGTFSPGPAIWVGEREVAHFDAGDILDVRLTRKVIHSRRPKLTDDDRISLRAGTSDWLAVRLTSQSDADFAFNLVEEAVAANAPSAEPGPPPTGADLARRRRFH